MLLNNPNVVSHPNADLVDVHASGRQQARERVTHHMRRYPRRALLSHVDPERSTEVVSVAVPPPPHGRTEHIGTAKSVLFEERAEFGRDGNRPLLTVLELNVRSLPQVQDARGEVEPSGNALRYFEAAEARVESREQDELQVFPWTLVDELVAQFRFAKIGAGTLIDARNLHVGGGIPSHDTLLNAPVEEAADDHQVAQRAGRRQASAAIAIERLDVSGCHIGGCDARRETIEECSERVWLIPSSGATVDVHIALVSDEPLNQSVDSAGRVEFGNTADLLSATDGLNEIAGFEADELPDFVALEGEPIDGTAKVYAACLAVHWRRLSQRRVTLSSEIAPLKELYAPIKRAGDETRTRDVLLGKEGASRGYCNVPKVTEAAFLTDERAQEGWK